MPLHVDHDFDADALALADAAALAREARASRAAPVPPAQHLDWGFGELEQIENEML